MTLEIATLQNADSEMIKDLARCMVGNERDNIMRSLLIKSMHKIEAKISTKVNVMWGYIPRMEQINEVIH